MMKRLFEKKIADRTRTGFVIAFLLLLIGNISAYVSIEKVKQQAQYVQRTNLIIDGLETSLSYIIRAESSFRGFLLDKDQLHHEVLVASIYRADSSFKNVIQLAATDSSHSDNIIKINTKIQAASEILHQSLDNFIAGISDSGEVRLEAAEAHTMIQDLENQIRRVQSEEETFATEYSNNAAGYINNIKFLSIISTFIAILLTLYSILVFNKENKAKKEADRIADVFKQKLQSQIAQLGEMNEELVKLRELEKYTATGRIARTIAHEVRNPLTNINLAVEQLGTEFEGSKDADTFLDMINRNSARINKLVSDLLNATKAADLRKRPVSINQLLDDCLKDAGDRIMLKHIRVVKNYNMPACTVSVDSEKMKIAILNFIVNGIEAMEDGGTLTISTNSKGNNCMVKIIDNGVGMTKEQLDRLFEPFYSTKKDGNGLGLANSHNIILSHNGEVSVQSKEGNGTIFTITLNHT